MDDDDSRNLHLKGNCMALIERFEDIQGWKSARLLTKEIYRLSRQGAFAQDFGLRDQICRAAVSSMANVAEGFDCDSPKEFARFLGIARRSAVEVQSLLYVALNIDYIDQRTFETQYALATKTKNLIGALKSAQTKRMENYWF